MTLGRAHTSAKAADVAKLLLLNKRYSALQNLTVKFWSAVARFKVSLRAGLAFEVGVYNKFSSVEHVIMSATLSPNVFFDWQQKPQHFPLQNKPIYNTW